MMPGEGKMDISIDRLPSPTWKWLGVNHADVSADIPEAAAPEITVPAGSPVTVSRTDAEDLSGMRTGCGPDMARLIYAAGDKAYEITVPAGKRPAEPVIIRADLAGGRSQAFRLVLRAGEGSEMTAVMVLSSSADAGGQAAVQTLIDAAPGAKVRLVQVDLLGSGFRLISDVGGRLGDRASADLADAILGGREIYTGRSIDLAGDSSRLGADVGYMIGGDTVLDMSYEAVHRGRRTESRMDAEGSLRGRSKKTFRGTIDFRSGCSGSKGSEKEDILMFDDGVENKTVPLILCAEEDVEGDHGATIGRLGDDVLFYMGSRGIDAETACRAIADSRLRKLCRMIPDAGIRLEAERFFDAGAEEGDE